MSARFFFARGALCLLMATTAAGTTACDCEDDGGTCFSSDDCCSGGCAWHEDAGYCTGGAMEDADAESDDTSS